MLNRTKLHNATRRGQKVDPSKFIEKWEFELTIPPLPPLGVKNIFKQQPTDRPLNPSFRPRIKVCCFDKEKQSEWLGGYRNFVEGYREVFEGFRKAASKRRRPTVEWPVGSYPPSCWYPVGHEEAA
jgi:hypothetical protein